LLVLEGYLLAFGDTQLLLFVQVGFFGVLEVDEAGIDGSDNHFQAPADQKMGSTLEFC
jgi:hypothetical protein